MALIFVLAGAGCGLAGETGQKGSLLRPAAAKEAQAAARGQDSGGVRITGLVERPQKLTGRELRELPQRTLHVTYETREGSEQHRYRGPRLYEVLERAGLKLDPARKNDELRKYAVVSAKDGYEVVVSYGELAPDFADAPILLAVQEDGRRLSGEDGPAKLVVPTDERGGRYVSGVAKVEVRDVDSPPRE